MNFNLVSTLLAVSSVHDTVHIFKLGQQAASKNGGEASNWNSSSANPPESVDGGASPSASLEGGYDSFIEKKQSKSLSYASPYFTQRFTPVLSVQLKVEFQS